MTAENTTPGSSTSKGGRAGGKKTRTGCITCKIRRVKCDEARPSCIRCKATGRRCDGYLESAIWKTTVRNTSLSEKNKALSVSPTYSLPSSPFRTPQEARAFDYFYHKAAPSLAGLADVDFWCSVVPQFGHNEPIFRDAIVAIGSMYEVSTTVPDIQLLRGSQSLISAQYHLSMKCYGRAITRIKDLVAKGQDTAPLAILSTILFACIEAIQDNIPQALGLVNNGAKLLISIYQSKNKLTADPIIKAVTPMMRWLGRVSDAFGDKGPLMVLEHGKNPTSLDEISTFSSFNEAHDTLHAHIPRIYAVYRDSAIYKSDPQSNFDLLPSIVAQQDAIRESLRTWLSIFQRSPLSRSVENRLAAALLLKEHATAIIYSQTSMITQQTEFDSFFPEFDTILHNVGIMLGADCADDSTNNKSSNSAAHFRFDSQINPTLCSVIIKCRLPQIRRRALGLLRLAPKREGVWRSATARRVMTRIIAYEEGSPVSDGRSLFLIEEASLPDEDRRAHEWKVLMEHWDMDESFASRVDAETVLMKMTRNVSQPDGTKRIVEDYIKI